MAIKSQSELDLDQCRKMIKQALQKPEPESPFDRKSWLTRTKENLKRHSSRTPSKT